MNLKIYRRSETLETFICSFFNPRLETDKESANTNIYFIMFCDGNTKMTNILDRDRIVNALFFLFLGMIGGFIGSGITSCGIQKIIIEGIYIKHVILFILIYFAIGFVDSSETNPLNIFLTALVIYVLFNVLMKSQKEYVIMLFVLLAFLYILRKVLESVDPSETNTINVMETVSSYLTVGMFLVLLVGFTIYFRRQYTEHRATFSLNKFFFGTNKCQNVK